jgi:hypothetical protein
MTARAPGLAPASDHGLLTVSPTKRS